MAVARILDLKCRLLLGDRWRDETIVESAPTHPPVHLIALPSLHACHAAFALRVQQVNNM